MDTKHLPRKSLDGSTINPSSTTKQNLKKNSATSISKSSLTSNATSKSTTAPNSRSSGSSKDLLNKTKDKGFIKSQEVERINFTIDVSSEESKHVTDTSKEIDQEDLTQHQGLISHTTF